MLPDLFGLSLPIHMSFRSDFNECIIVKAHIEH